MTQPPNPFPPLPDAEPGYQVPGYSITANAAAAAFPRLWDTICDGTRLTGTFRAAAILMDAGHERNLVGAFLRYATRPECRPHRLVKVHRGRYAWQFDDEDAPAQGAE